MSTPTPSVLTFPGKEALARAAAEEVVRLSIAAVRERGRAAVALAGGSTPEALYRLLADEPAFRARMPWAQTHFFFGDERHVPPDHKDSNYRMAAEALLRKVAGECPAANVHRIPAENPDAARAASIYEADIRSFFEGETTPAFDLVLLGMGPDGHTASLFPGTTGLREAEKLVAAVWVDKFTTYRITFTPPLLAAARDVVFLSGGEEKADMLKTVLEGPFELDRYPSQRIVAENPRARWLVDEAAAAKLTGNG